MRIEFAHMHHAASEGTERYLNQIAAHMGERDHQVTRLCRSHEEPPYPAVRFERLRGFLPTGAWRLWAFADEQSLLLFLGSGFGRKGLDRVLGVLPALLKKRPQVRLLVVGRDSAPTRWQAQACQLGHPHDIFTVDS